MKKMWMLSAVICLAVAGVSGDEGGRVVKASEVLPRKIDLSNIVTLPIGDLAVHADGRLKIPDSPADGMVEIEVPPEWSRGGTCGALRVSGVFAERGTGKILGGKSSCVYATVAEGAYAITNGILSAVSRATGGQATVMPMRIETDGSGTMKVFWNAGREAETELLVRFLRNQARQMAVCCCLHTKGDDIRCELGHVR